MIRQEVIGIRPSIYEATLDLQLRYDDLIMSKSTRDCIHYHFQCILGKLKEVGAV